MASLDGLIVKCLGLTDSSLSGNLLIRSKVESKLSLCLGNLGSFGISSGFGNDFEGIGYSVVCCDLLVFYLGEVVDKGEGDVFVGYINDVVGWVNVKILAMRVPGWILRV